MEKILFLKKQLEKAGNFVAFLVLTVGIMLCAESSKAQLYYVTSDGAGASTSVNDAIFRYNGSSSTSLTSSFANAPGAIAVDLAGNRLFVIESFNKTTAPTVADNAINVINATSGALITSITTSVAIVGLKYDAANDYIYYLTSDGNASKTTSNDAIWKVRPDGTGTVQVVASVTGAPTLFALDVANNRAFVFDHLITTNTYKIVNLTDGTITSVPQSLQIVAMDYDAVDNYIYYLTSDGSASTLGANDALKRMDPAGTNSIVIKASIAKSPQLMALDAGNDRVYIFEGTAIISPKALDQVIISTGALSTLITFTSPGTPGSTIIAGLAVPSRALLSTTSATSITPTSATLGGNVTHSDLTVTERGVVYSSTNATPTTADNKAAIGSGTGSFSSSITGLSGSTTYYVRAYATSGAGTSYGAVSSFATTASPTTIGSINRVTSSPSNSATVQYAVSFGASVTGLTTSNFSLTTSGVSGTSISSLSGSGANYTVTVNTGSGDGSIALNLANATGLTPGISTSLPYAGQSYTIDKTAPTISISSPSVVGTTTGPVSYTVTYADANFNTSTLGTSNITLNQTGTANGTVAVTGSGTSYTVTISAISGVGTLGITIAANTASDQAGNNAPSAGPSSTFSVGSSDATLSNLVLSRIKNGHLSTAIFNPVFNSGTNDYTLNAPNSTTTVNVTPTTNYTAATVTVNGAPVASGSASSNIGLNVGPNTITVIVTAQDATTNTYTLSIDRRNSAGQLNALYQPVSVNRSGDPQPDVDGITVHPALSPNGDGINDVFTIDGITAYPDNKVTILNRDGVTVYNARGYDNSTKVFDGHSNINGQMLVAGTYFYTVDYQAGGDTKHKTGFVVLKY